MKMKMATVATVVEMEKRKSLNSSSQFLVDKQVKWKVK